MVVFTHTNHITKLLNLIQEIPEPENNSIIVSSKNDKYSEHMSYIETVKLFRGFHRKGSDGDFDQVNSIEDIENNYLNSLIPQLSYEFFSKPLPTWTHKYYKLPELKKIPKFIHNQKLKSWSKKVIELYNKHS